MDNLSVYVWEIMNRKVGCMEEILLRREVNNLNDKLASDFEVSEVLSGSRGEGFVFSDSDTDDMYILNTISVLPVECVPEETCDIIMETENQKPGFTQLRIGKKSNILGSILINDSTVEVANNLYISSLFFRDKTVAAFQLSGLDDSHTYGHGPCATTTETLCATDCDRLICFSCLVWPNVASEWIDRSRPNNWPTRDLVKEIVSNGCLLVPTGNKLSPESHMEWRMSFSLAEKKLVHSMNHTQFLCYGLLKLVLKHDLDTNDDTKELMCSYFMKTVMFYCIEDEAIIWNKSTLLQCFLTCIKRLIQWVKAGFCPNYFVCSNNMFEGKIYGNSQRNLLVYLTKLHADYITPLSKIPFLSNLNIVLNNEEMLLGTEMTDREKEYRCFKECQKRGCADLTVENINERQCKIQALLLEPTKSNIAKDHLHSMRSDLNRCLTELLYEYSCRIGNKSRYTLLAIVKKYILRDCTQGDNCSGLLQYATLSYLTGQYREVIRIVRHVLSGFKPFTLYLGALSITNEKNFMEMICNRGLSTTEKAKHFLAQSYITMSKCGFYPSEIKPEIDFHSTHGIAIIHPVVYANILLFLSYKWLDLNELKYRTLMNLKKAVTGDVCDRLERPIGLTLLEKCLHIDMEEWSRSASV